MTAFKAVLFDIDGTLADCEPRNRSVIEDVAAAHGGKIEKHDWRILAGTNDRFIHEWLLQKFPALSIDCDTFVEDVKKGYLTRAFEVVARKGMPENIAHIQSRKIPMAAVTNSPIDIASVNIGATGCRDYMKFLLTSDQVLAQGRPIKPAPDPYLIAAHRLKVDPSLCLVFEDSKSGVNSGVAAGCTVIQIVDEKGMENPSAHYHVYDAKTLQSLCKKLIP